MAVRRLGAYDSRVAGRAHDGCCQYVRGACRRTLGRRHRLRRHRPVIAAAVRGGTARQGGVPVWSGGGMAAGGTCMQQCVHDEQGRRRLAHVPQAYGSHRHRAGFRHHCGGHLSRRNALRGEDGG
ncbi:MAG: hypothetical protein IKT00_00765 [Prevotella sp.]|nr:hypothetical protein [Prevotella sp.]